MNEAIGHRLVQAVYGSALGLVRDELVEGEYVLFDDKIELRRVPLLEVPEHGVDPVLTSDRR